MAVESGTLRTEENTPGLEPALRFETAEQIFERVFREWDPRAPVPGIEVTFQRFANANSFIRLENCRATVRITDVLEGAPEPVLEALAHILWCKLYRRRVPPAYNRRYRLYLNRKDTRATLEKVRQERGHKRVLPAAGKYWNLEEIFDVVNFRYFHGLMARPELGWSRQVSSTMLGHYDSSHNMIVISRILDQPGERRLALEFVMFHEMLHLRYPVQHRGARRCVHGPEFRRAEKEFERWQEAEQMLKDGVRSHRGR